MITLPEKFQNDIQAREVWVNQFVVINHPVTKLYLAKNKQTLRVTQQEHFSNVKYFEDRDLKISSIKQSIKTDTKKFSISNVSITLSNYSVSGYRFSDIYREVTNIDIDTVPGGIGIIPRMSLMNTEVKIYYGTQNAKTLEDCLHVYTGKVRKYTAGEKKVIIDLEDSTQEKLHKDLPKARIPDNEWILDSYKNKYIPILYGKHDKAPLVYYRHDPLDTDFIWLPDNVYLDSDEDFLGGKTAKIQGFYQEETKESLVAYKGDYFNIPPIRSSFSLWIDSGGQQYSVYGGRYIRMTKDSEAIELIEQEIIQNEYSSDEERLAYLNQLPAITNDIFEGYIIKTPQTVSLLDKFVSANGYSPPVDTHYKGITGVGGATEEVHLTPYEEGNSSFYFPENVPDSSQEPVYRGFEITNIVDTASPSGNPTLAKDGDGNSLGYYGQGFEATGSLYRKARDSGWWITRLPTPWELIDDYLLTWGPAHGYTPEELSGVPQMLGGFNLPIEDNAYKQYNYDWYLPGAGGSARGGVLHRFYYYQYYAHFISGTDIGNYAGMPFAGMPAPFKEWWFGESGGVYGADNGEGPVVKSWSENFYATTHDVSRTIYQSSSNYTLTYNIKKANLFLDEYYRMDKFHIDSQSIGGWNNTDDYSPTGENNLMMFYDPENDLIHTAVHAKFEPQFGDTPTIWTWEGRAFYSNRGYLSVDDATKISILSNSEGAEAVKVNVNYEDIETEDIISEITNDDGDTVFKTYNNFISQSIESNGIINQDEGYHGVASEHHDFIYAVNLSSIESPFTLFSDAPNQLADSSWKSPNDYNEIGYRYITFNGNNNIELSASFSNLSLKHYCNFEQLEKTNLYGRVIGRIGEWAFHPVILGEGGSNYDFNNSTTTNLGPPWNIEWDYEELELSSYYNLEYWTIYPLYSGAIKMTIMEPTLVDGVLMVMPTQLEEQSVSIWRIYYTLAKKELDLHQYGTPVWIPEPGVGFNVSPGGEDAYFEGLEEFLNNGGTHEEFAIYAWASAMHAYMQTEPINPDTGALYGSEDEIWEWFFNNIFAPLIDAIWADENHVIDNPAYIVSSLFESELNFKADISDTIIGCAEAHSGWRFAFSVNDKINSKKLIEEISSNSKMFPKLRPQDGSLSFVYLKSSYTLEDVDRIIRIKDIIKYDFSKASIGDVKYKIKVLYKKDLELDEYEKTTDYISISDILPYYNTDFYGIDEEDAILDFESDYIREEATAIELRDYLCMQRSIQKLQIKLDLPLSYSNLETGDIILIEELIASLKAYGIDYSTYSYLNGSILYPYFILTSINISTVVKIELEQLHNLDKNNIDFFAVLASQGFTEEEIDAMLESQQEDYYIPEIATGCTYGDADNYDENAVIDDGSCTFTTTIIDSGEYELGDLNFDGDINVLDIVMLVVIIMNRAPTGSNEGDFLEMHDIVLQSYFLDKESFHDSASNKIQASNVSLSVVDGFVSISKNGFLKSIHITFDGNTGIKSKLNSDYHIFLGNGRLIILLFGNSDMQEELFEFSGMFKIKTAYGYNMNNEKILFNISDKRPKSMEFDDTVWSTSGNYLNTKPQEEYFNITPIPSGKVINNITKLKKHLKPARYDKDIKYNRRKALPIKENRNG